MENSLIQKPSSLPFAVDELTRDFNQLVSLETEVSNDLTSPSASKSATEQNTSVSASGNIKYQSLSLNEQIHSRCRDLLEKRDNMIVELATDSSLSQILLQSLVNGSDPDIKEGIYESVIRKVEFIIINNCGSFFFNKFIDLLESHWLLLLTSRITRAKQGLILLLQDRYGSNSIKKLIEVVAIHPPLIDTIVAAISDEFVPLMNNSTAFSKGICRCLEILTPHQNQALYRAAADNCLCLARDPKGCRNLQKFMDHTNGIYKDMLLNIVSENSEFLSQDGYGNYVVSHVLKYRNSLFCNKIYRKLQGYYARLSMQQGGSHVVETCLKTGGEAFVIEEFVQENAARFLELARDRYGNYVIQTALEVTHAQRTPLYRSLVLKLEPQFEALMKSGYGKNIIQKLGEQILVQ